MRYLKILTAIAITFNYLCLSAQTDSTNSAPVQPDSTIQNKTLVEYPSLPIAKPTPPYEGTDYNKYKLPSIYFGYAYQSFYGDLGESNSLYFNTRFRSGFNIGMEKRFGKFLGAAIDLSKGKLSENEYRKNGRHYNFETKFLNTQAKLFLHFDQLFVGRKTKFSGYAYGGFGFFTFDPYGDLYSANNNKYYYWQDGTIRDTKYDSENPQNGNQIERDYKYETKLDSLNKYKNNGLSIPVGFGVKYKLSDRFEVNVDGAYYMTNSDRIDNVNNKNLPEGFFKASGDGFFQGTITLQYNLSGRVARNTEYDKINFSKLNKEDEDGDQIADIVDQCPGTPSGVKVDKKGCPEDTDGDAVPDYLDKDNSTIAGAYVDENGVALDSLALYQIYLKDSLLTSGDWDIYVANLKRQRIKDSLLALGITPPLDSTEIAQLKEKARIDSINNAGRDKIWAIVDDNKIKGIDTTATTPPKIENISSAQKGVIYRIQIASSANKVPPSYFKTRFNITQVVFVSFQMGAYKYCIGSFTDYEEAKKFNEKFKEKYNFGSFITPYKDGVRITMQEAMGK